jgi:hypothetical protein
VIASKPANGGRAGLASFTLPRSPSASHSLRAALEKPVGTNLFEMAIPGFVLHWDCEDLIRALGNRPFMWTDSTDWMDEVVPLGFPL